MNLKRHYVYALAAIVAIVALLLISDYPRSQRPNTHGTGRTPIGESTSLAITSAQQVENIAPANPKGQESVAEVTHNDSYTIPTIPGATVLDAMKEHESKTRFTFTGEQHPGLGFFVESINRKPGKAGYYWFLYVNGESSDMGASQTILKAGDIVEWRYQKSN